MILSTLSNSKEVEELHPLFKKAFDYIKSNDLLKMELGRIELDGDNLFINNSEVDAMKQDEQIVEIHREYIDIHVLLSGKERIGWLPSDKLKTIQVPFKEDTDFSFYTDKPTTYIDLEPGDFVILYPEDGHSPIIGNGKIRKLVVKIKRHI